MKLLKTTAVALLFTILFALFCGGVQNAYAFGEGLVLSVEKTDDTVEVTMVARRNLNFGGMSGVFSYDHSAFDFVSCRPVALSPAVNVNTGKFIADTGQNLDVKKGDAIIVFVFKTTNGYQPDNSYDFIIDMDSVYDFDLVKFFEKILHLNEIYLYLHWRYFDRSKKQGGSLKTTKWQPGKAEGTPPLY